MENVDICIELVRIREFDSSGGRIEFFKRIFPSFSNSFNILFSQLFACMDIRLHSLFGDSISRIRELENFLLRAMERISLLNW